MSEENGSTRVDCARAELWMTGALGGELAAEERAALDRHLAACSRCAAAAAAYAELWRGLGRLPAVEPSPYLAARFERMLGQEIEREAARRPQPAAPSERPGRRWALAAAALAASLALGVALGAALAGGRGADPEVAALRREIGSLQELVAVSLLAQASPSERLQGVAYGRELAAREPRVLEALFAALASDPNVNVRLAALEALAPVTAQPDRGDRRQRLVRAVATQSSPLVQLTAIDLLLEADGEAARRDLEQLADDPELDPAVASYLRDRLGRSV
jgi:predicted anti-sigma-YlaC factor YlaD